jgi:hypothetical protein
MTSFSSALLVFSITYYHYIVALTSWFVNSSCPDFDEVMQVPSMGDFDWFGHVVWNWFWFNDSPYKRSLNMPMTAISILNPATGSSAPPGGD